MFAWSDSENVKIIKEAINTESSRCIDAYQALLRHYATGKLSIDKLLDTSMKEMGESVKKCMNFANVLLMLHDFFGTPFSGVLNNEKFQKRLEEILIFMIAINNLASRKLAWLVKSAADLNRLLMNAHNEHQGDFTIDLIQQKIFFMNDIGEAQITKIRVDEHIASLQRDHKFIQSVIDSFIPLEYKENPLEKLLKFATDTRDQVDALLVRLITIFGLNLFRLSVYLIYSL
ncbi:unnamed protein product, partial [Rodentolepis nana]|uniref:Exocyst complex component Sec8 n=1 Tax=Rodentolepis nana TaxID=102285 RepID=A0A0R3U023_RODNA